MSGPTGPHVDHELPAVPSSVTPLRHRVVAFASANRAAPELVDAMALAVSEVVGNVVMHAYRDQEPGTIRLCCWADGERLVVEVRDAGLGMAPRRDSPGLGHGLATVGALAQTLDVETGPGGRGTVVRMAFGPSGPPPDAPGLEPLCPLALERLADACCVDVHRDGVLRRVTAEVAGEPGLSTWLRASTPPAKPGTATWTALRAGGPRLVVHDPSMPRSPGGPGERLGLTWWVSVPLDGPDGAPLAVWGFGGREGGRAVPSDDVVRVLAEAARGDLADPAQRDRLRERLRRLDGYSSSAGSS